MMKRILLALTAMSVIAINPAIAADLSPSPSSSVILLKVTRSQAEKLELVIPKGTKPGYHIITVQILDAKGIVSSHDVAFCKMPSGVINWNNKCPGLASPTGSNQGTEGSQGSGSTSSKGASSTLNLALLAILVVAGGFWFIAAKRRKDEEEDEE